MKLYEIYGVKKEICCGIDGEYGINTKSTLVERAFNGAMAINTVAMYDFKYNEDDTVAYHEFDRFELKEVVMTSYALVFTEENKVKSIQLFDSEFEAYDAVSTEENESLPEGYSIIKL